MKIGLDYWNCCSHHPDYFRSLATLALTAGHEVHVVSAVGRRHAGSVASAIAELEIPVTAVHEVLFKHPVESPSLKVAKCLELGFGREDVFYDDRDDVCREHDRGGNPRTAGHAGRTGRRGGGAGVSKEDFADLLGLAVKGSRDTPDGCAYPDDLALLEKFRAWLAESEIMTAREAGRA